MIKGRFLTSFMIIGLVAALMAGATMAVFTSTATNENNIFETGTLEVAADDQVYGGEIEVANMAPGDEFEGSFVVSNIGSLELYYKVTAIASGDLFELDDNHAYVTILTNETGVLDPAGGSTPAKTVTFKIIFPEEAGDAYQGKSGTLQFKVDAVQTGGNYDYMNHFNP